MDELQVETTRIVGGADNLGIFKNKVLHNDSGTLFSFIEKRVPPGNRNNQEIIIYKDLHRRYIAGAETSPLPAIFGVNESPEYISVLMPFYNGVGRKHDEIGEYTRSIVNSIVKLNNMSLPVTRRWGLARGERYIESFENQQLHFKSYADLISQAAHVFRRAIEISTPAKMVLSHNDLHYGNIAYQQPKSDSGIATFIDAGGVGYNYVGADLFHFARLDAIQGIPDYVLTSMATRYGELTDTPASLILLNAYCWALHRLLRATIPNAIKSGRTRSSNTWITSARVMLERAESLINNRPSSTATNTIPSSTTTLQSTKSQANVPAPGSQISPLNTSR